MIETVLARLAMSCTECWMRQASLKPYGPFVGGLSNPIPLGSFHICCIKTAPFQDTPACTYHSILASWHTQDNGLINEGNINSKPLCSLLGCKLAVCSDFVGRVIVVARRMSCVMLYCWSLPTSRICQMPWTLQRSQTNWVCILFASVTGKSSAIGKSSTGILRIIGWFTVPRLWTCFCFIHLI